MQNTTPPRTSLNDLPLWRLLVELDDVERTVGPDSSTARVLARLIQERLRGLRGQRGGEASRAPNPNNASAGGRRRA